MAAPPPGSKLDQELERVRAQNERLREHNVRLHEHNERLREEIERLRREQEKLEEELKAALRSAAPFRRRASQKIPPQQRKKPGRRPGHVGQSRPIPDHVDECVELPLERCPSCGGREVHSLSRLEQYIEEIPPCQPQVLKLVTYSGVCASCGPVRTRHPWQTSTAQGAAKVHLGPRALALAIELNQGLGLTMRTSCRILRALCGLRLSPGGLAQAGQRVARKLEPQYRALEQDLRQSPAVFCDETSWWVGGPGWWLWILTTPQTTVYRVEPHRSSEVVSTVLGPWFDGVLVSDCLLTYNSLAYDQHKCIGHHRKAISRARDRPDTQDPSYLEQWTLLFKVVTALHALVREHGFEAFAQPIENLEQWSDRLLAEPRGQPGDIAIQNRLRRVRSHLFRCLYRPDAEPTNDRSERGLRPAVIARKLSAGNKTVSGKTAWEILASLWVTCRQRHMDFCEYLTQHLALVNQPG